MVGIISPVRIKYKLDGCFHEGDCRKVCLVPHVLDTVIKGRAVDTEVPIGPDCTRCGLCVDATPTGPLDLRGQGTSKLMCRQAPCSLMNQTGATGYRYIGLGSTPWKTVTQNRPVVFDKNSMFALSGTYNPPHDPVQFKLPNLPQGPRTRRYQPRNRARRTHRTDRLQRAGKTTLIRCLLGEYTSTAA